MNDLKDEQLKCLIMWQEGTVGYYQEFMLIKTLNELCKKFGYGRVPQIAQQIEQIWRDEDKIQEFEKIQQEHIEFIKECRKDMK